MLFRSNELFLSDATDFCSCSVQPKTLSVLTEKGNKGFLIGGENTAYNTK